MDNKSKIRNFILILLTIAAIAMMTGCGTDKDNERLTNDQTVEQEVVEPSSEEAEETVVEETTENVAIEEQPSEEVQEGPQTIGQWSKSLDRAEPKLTIWNNETKEGTVLENGDEYVIKDGDQLILCYEGEETYFTMKSPILTSEISSTNYRIIDIIDKPIEPTMVEFSHLIDGVEYVYQVTLVADGITTSSKSNDSNELSGKEWAISLEYDSPKLIVWNDELNTKVELEEGQEYQMQPGDVLAVCGPEDYFPEKVYPEDFSESIVFGFEYSIIKYIMPEGKDPINFVLEGWIGEEASKVTCTLIPYKVE